MKQIIVITGPTGVGKTKLSLALAKNYQGEIINADAMQIYKDLNIGTAKIKKEEMGNIPHHLFNIKEVTEEYSIYNYQKDCRLEIENILKKEKTPILVGGTGLYLKAALYDYQLTKEKNKNSYKSITTDTLWDNLLKLDPKAINQIDKHNRQRIINAINYYQTNKKSITENKTNKILYQTIFIGLTTSRENLYNIINKRVDQMIDEGLIEEVRYFYNQKIFTKPLINGIGYKELYQYFAKKITLEEAISLIKKNSRHYAKRQYTFFNHQLPITWFDVNYNNFDETCLEVKKYINEYLKERK